MVAMDVNGVIGRGNALPWRLSSDLKRFKAVTLGKPIVMGRKTHDSIGRPLPGRKNIVITRNPDYAAPGCTVVHDLDEALVICRGEPEIVVIGGSEIYRQSLPRADRIYLTEVHAEVEGDVCFPDMDKSEWQEVEREEFGADEKNEFPFSFVILDRRVDKRSASTM